MRLTPLVWLLAISCGTTHELEPLDSASQAGTQPLRTDMVDFERAPPPSDILSASALPGNVPQQVDSYFDGFGSRRMHVQLDRPMYRPGDSVWLKSWSVLTKGITPDAHQYHSLELVDPRGQVVATLAGQSGAGAGAAQVFDLAADAPGGRWMVRATLPTGLVEERPFVVSSYTPPRIKKTLDFVREAYGPGERVEALVEMTAPDGSPLADHPVRAMLQVAGQQVHELALRTDETGAVFVAASLPEGLDSSDGLLSVLVEKDGLTESISRSVPIVLADVSLSFFPEGGDLVTGLHSRVYFEATNAFGEPADVAGFITDDRGTRVAELQSLHDGMGRFALTPEPGRSYTAHITEPASVEGTFDLPTALGGGCVLRSFDDIRSEKDSVRIGVRCHTEREVLVSGIFGEQSLDAVPVLAGPGEDAVVYFDLGKRRHEQGAVQVTLFDKQLNPMAERLVYRGAGKNLGITITPDRDSYGPRDEVVLSIETADPSGWPVSAELALSVLDDAVVGLADDQEGHMLSRMYLEPDVMESPKDPGFYFDPDEELAARGLDLVMGTRGYRRFEWVEVFNPPKPGLIARTATMTRELLEGAEELAFDLDGFAPMDALAGGMAGEGAIMEAPVARQAVVADKAMPAPMEMAAAPAAVAMAEAPPPPPPRMELRRDKEEMDMGFAAGDMEFEMADEPMLHGGRARRQLAEPKMAIRVFPRPDYSAGFDGVRSDFRDTVLWEPSVQTDAEGRAEVRFYLSDALTTFRVVAEGIGSGAAGHSEATLTSQLPVSLATRLPPAVSAGDELHIPLTVTSSRPGAIKAHVKAALDSELASMRNAKGSLSLDPRSGDTWWVPVTVGQGSGSLDLSLSVEGGGMSDTLERSVAVVPAGFPRNWSQSGEMEDRISFEVELDKDVVPGSLSAAVTWQPSTVSSLIDGMEGLIRTPGGCFEQTSSTNWPNVAILNYLEAHDGDPRLRVKSAQALEVGYNKLSGYQVNAGGFETWGSGPGKEVLSAFGLLQFADMAEVYPVDKSILSKDVDYLLGQRDGKGGFSNTGESAHGYGSAPKPILDGFITYALAKTGYVSKLDKEIAQQAETAKQTKDPYVLALAARVLHAAKHRGAEDARKRLAAMQAEDGSFPGAESSITRSYEANLLVESTALAALALMDGNGHRGSADKAVQWLLTQRRGAGTWGATQATALALDALTTHANLNKRPRTGGSLAVEVNGQAVGSLTYTADTEQALVIDDWSDALVPGKNTVVLRQLEGESLPFTVDVSWKSVTPDSAPGAELSLQTELAGDEAGMGDTVRLTTTVGNLTGEIVPSPIARIGLPAGLEAQTWQLDELKERGVIAFYETRPREVTLYWDGIHADETHEVKLDLLASVPGRFTAPASSAYPYYDDDEMAWAAGTRVVINP